MASEIPIIPKAQSITIHTGNIVNWNRLKKKLTQSPREELTECIGSTLETWLTEQEDRDKLQYADQLGCFNTKFIEKLPKEERPELKLTVKICIYKLCEDEIQTAIQRVQCELGVDHIETVLLSVPAQYRQTIDTIKPLWQILETFVEKEVVYSLGISDLDKDHLEELYNFAKVKPCINQVNLESCCVIPPELSQFAKEHDIQLLTHNDPTDLLPAERLQEVMRSRLTGPDGDGWGPCWIIRYSVLIKSRGVVKSKGYIVLGSRDLMHRN